MHTVCLPHDWLTWRLAGAPGLPALVTDRGDASGTGYWSPATGEYRPDLLSRAFGAVELSYPVFEFLRLFDRQVLRFRWPPLSQVIAWADAALVRLIPPARRFSFRVLVTATPPRGVA